MAPHHEEGGERQRHAEEDVGDDGRGLGEGPGGQQVGHHLLEVLEAQAAVLDAPHDGGEVVVQQDHVGRLLGHVGAGQAHGDAHVGLAPAARAAQDNQYGLHIVRSA